MSAPKSYGRSGLLKLMPARLIGWWSCSSPRCCRPERCPWLDPRTTSVSRRSYGEPMVPACTRWPDGHLARAWSDSGGQVIGLAPSAAAAAQLRDATCAPVETLAKLTWSIHHDELPDWAERIGRSTFVIIDEAGMADTLSLDTAVQFITDRPRVSADRPNTLITVDPDINNQPATTNKASDQR